MLLFEHGPQVLEIQLSRVVEVRLHVGAESFIALRDLVVEVADRHHLPELQGVPLLHQQLQHDLQGGTLPLQQRRHRHQRFDQGGTERIQLAEVLSIAGAREQHPHDFFPCGRRARELLIHQALCFGRFRTEDALLRDHRQVAIFEFDQSEPPFPIRQHVRKTQALRSSDVMADQLPQVALPRHKADNRHRSISALGLHQLGNLLRLSADEIDVRRVARQPEDQFVEEQNQPVVAQRLRMGAQDRQPVVEADEFLRLFHRREERVNQVADQLMPRRIVRRTVARLVVGTGVPGRTHLAPAVRRRSCLQGSIQRLEELRVPEPLPQPVGINEQLLRAIHGGRRGLRLHHRQMTHVAAQHGRLQALRSDQMIRHEEKLFALHPAVVLRDDCGKLLNRTRLRVALKNQVQHGHEMTLAAAETPMQIRRLARVPLHRALDE